MLIGLLGLGLAHMYRQQLEGRALDQAVSVADAIANAGIEPTLLGRDLSRPMRDGEKSRLATTTTPFLQSGTVARLRLRDRIGRVVFDAAHPDQAPKGAPDDEVVQAASGQIVRKLTRMNSDQVDSADLIGEQAVEVYLPLHANSLDQRVIGVLEIYLPYAPIEKSFAQSNRVMQEVIALGLLALWIALSAITWSVTRRLRRSAATNEHLAFYDQLTDLPNRVLFGDRADHDISAARRSSIPVAIAIIDLDRFMEVNDTLGHNNGDLYLRHVAKVLGNVLRPGDTLARLGGDEFGLVLPGVDPCTARPVLERVQHALAEDFEIDGVTVSSEASIGLAFWPTDATAADELLRHADLAMHAAKQTGHAILEYTTDMIHFSPDRLALMSQMRHAIENDEFVLYFQPKLDLQTNTISGAEALLRWRHPTRGLMLPDEFINVAECTGLIDPLTDWVIEHASAQIARWHSEGQMLSVAVNISARNLRQESFPRRVMDLLNSHRVAAEYLEFEITETALMSDPGRSTVALQRLRLQGVQLSLDDFGKGYTSLAQLGSLPLSELKIDRCFVANMLTNPSDGIIVSTVIDLAHDFGLTVVAEGVESTEIAEALTKLGCDKAQGYLLTPALPPEQLLEWIRHYDRDFRPPADEKRMATTSG